jgi:CobQ-like glutamine amidotransferase family enzyme
LRRWRGIETETEIEILFPEICNLFGDPQNARLLLRAIPGATARRTQLKARPAFLDRDVGLVYMGSMTERGQALAAAALTPFRREIAERIDAGARVLATGNALEIFGEYIEDGGERIEGLGLFNVCARRDMSRRYNGLYLGTYGDIDIVGFKSQFSHLYGTGSGSGGGESLFDTVRGAGRRPGEKAEGLRRRNFMASYVLGPILMLNPPWAKRLLEEMGARDAELPFERAMFDAYEARVREFKNPKTGFEY